MQDSIPALTRGEGGIAPALLVAENDDRRVCLPRHDLGAFDLTDRGVKGREAPGPLDAFLYTERGVYRPGEEVHITASRARQGRQGRSLPVTLIVTRPDGVEYRRYTLADKGLGGRELDLPLAGSAMTGTWRRETARGSGRRIRSRRSRFLVEDFVPERLDMKLEPPAAALAPQDPQTIKATGRYLYGPPAAGLGIEGEIVVEAVGRRRDGLSGYVFGAGGRDRLSPCASRSMRPLPPTRTARPTSPITLPQMPHTREAARSERHRCACARRRPHDRTHRHDAGRPARLRASASSRCSTARISTRTRPRHSRSCSSDGDGKRVAAPQSHLAVARLDTNWQWYRRDGTWTTRLSPLTRKIAQRHARRDGRWRAGPKSRPRT